MICIYPRTSNLFLSFFPSQISDLAPPTLPESFNLILPNLVFNPNPQRLKKNNKKSHLYQGWPADAAPGKIAPPPSPPTPPGMAEHELAIKFTFIDYLWISTVRSFLY